MDCAHVDDSYESYILGALDSDEMGSMAAHIDGCARCQAKLRPEAEAVAALAYAVPQQSAPASVKMRLFERIDASAAPDRRWDLAGFLDKVGARMVASYQMALASSLVAVIVLGGVWFNNKLDQVDLESQELATRVQQMSEDEAVMKEMVAQQRYLTYWAAAPDVSVTRLSATNISNRARGMVMVSASASTALISALNLVPLPLDKVYKVWLVREGVIYDAGSFTVDETGYGQAFIELIAPFWQIERIIITVEGTDSSAGPRGESVLKVDL